MSSISILLVDDHPIVREGYRRLLERQPMYRVCAEADDAAKAYQAYKDLKPDVVVMDLTLDGASGLEALRHIREWDKDAKLLVFTMHQGSAFALKAFEAGASGYVTKSSEPSELVRAVEVVARGGRVLSEDISKAIAADRVSGAGRLIEDLTPRETEILRLLASGLTSEAIAEILNLSHKTVRNHHYAIKSKIGARNDAHLVWLAISCGLVDANQESSARPSSK
ncbi:MAG: response regulator transcription factor [Hyphomicrobium sp.]|jgi:DNA-binding NarL/FixJ family response regulator